MKWMGLLLLLLTTALKAQTTHLFAIGQITGTGARIAAVADTIRGVHCWKAFTLSDHEGEKDIEDAFPVTKSGCCTFVYQFNRLKPKTTYECIVLYRDTFVRDTFTTSGAPMQGKWSKKKNPLTYNGQTYSSAYIIKALKARATFAAPAKRKEEDEN